MSLAAVTAKARGQVLHLGRADTGGYYCGGRPTKNGLFTWRPEEATCQNCVEKYKAERMNQASEFQR